MLQNQRGGLGAKIGIVGGCLIVLIAILIAVYGVSISNQEIRLRNKIGAQDQVIEAFFDKMWKVIKQQAGVTEEFKESFRTAYKDIIAGRYSGEGKGQMMLWIKEANPEYKPGAAFEKLMVSIEAQREGFFVEQKKIVDMINVHKDLIQTFPSSLFVGSRPLIVYEVISSTQAKEVMKTRKDDDIDLFNKKD
jgi:hypothetical protein